MAKKVNPLAVLATALVTLPAVSGCGAGREASLCPRRQCGKWAGQWLMG